MVLLSTKRRSCYRISGKSGNNRWFYLDSGAMLQKNGRKSMEAILFQQKSQMKMVDKYWRSELLFIQDGSMQTGWLQYKGQQYYFAQSGEIKRAG